MQKITAGEFLEREDFEEGFFYELIEGQIVKKQTSSPQHQLAVVKILVRLDAFVTERNLGKCLCAPVDVFLDEWNYYQPDILFIGNERLSIITPDGVQGAPDLVVEVLSQSSIRNDRTDKMRAYRRHGVREYWIADPKSRTVEIYSLVEGEYEMSDVAAESGPVRSRLLDGLAVELAVIFG